MLTVTHKTEFVFVVDRESKIEGGGSIHVAEFQQQGSHRMGKRVWEEYGYVWLARQVAPEGKKIEGWR